MVVVCAGTTGYHGVVNLRYRRMRQKRVQDSHFANGQRCHDHNELIRAGRIDPCLSHTFDFAGIAGTYQLTYEDRRPYGNIACLVGAAAPGATDADV